MSINIVLQDGQVKSPALRYGADGKPEFRFTLVQTEHTPDGRRFPLYLPCCAVGRTAERLASELEEDMHVVVTSGKLSYRKRETKLGEQSRLEILVWTVQTPEPALAGMPVTESSGSGEGDSPPEKVVMRGEAKQGKPRYPKWKPTPPSAN